ncbi:Uncharacterized conserved protein (DUF2075) [Xylographa soralifera]|nr:Uncharacterized conserved protein (DUF2075) [Xylographa soralifera]
MGKEHSKLQDLNVNTDKAAYQASSLNALKQSVQDLNVHPNWFSCSMTLFRVERLPFELDAINNWMLLDPRHANWPVVYILDGDRHGQPFRRKDELSRHVYVGESLNAAARMRRHLVADEKKHLSTIRVVVEQTFNKSVCLDLESYLIRMLAGDGVYNVLNRNDGITEADYYNRENYQKTFRDIFERLRDDCVFTRTIPQIENSDLFKLSPFKALSPDQAIAVEDILNGLFKDIELDQQSTIVIQGDPGTGKTVIAIYMLKLLVDIATKTSLDDIDSDSMFSDFFTEGNREALASIRLGLVVPQQSLRKSIKRVFQKTPGLRQEMVLTPFEVAECVENFDILVVDEAHRLNQRANQPSAGQNKKFEVITQNLFGTDDLTKTQLDWIAAKSKHQIFLLDTAQSVRPADVPSELLDQLVAGAAARSRHYPLTSQMRVKAGSDYVGYIRQVLLGAQAAAVRHIFDGYDLRMFDRVSDMHDEIRRQDTLHGLSRLVAGYAWPWKTKKDKIAFDIEIDNAQLRWNNTQTDWIASQGSLEEVGSIHTVQGYDLNYAGVIIGPDLRYNAAAGRLFVARDSYFDKKGKENNPRLGKKYTDEDLLRFVRNVYAVLLTRGIRGTFVYVCDPSLRAYFRDFVPLAVEQQSPG